MKLRYQKHALQLCSWCPKLCRFSCPVALAERRETVTPWGKMSLVELFRTGVTDLDHDVGEVPYHCLGCLHCNVYCRHSVDVPTALVAARRIMLEQGLAPPMVQRMCDYAGEGCSPRGSDLRPLLDELDCRQYRIEGARAVLFAGCRQLERRHAVETTFRVFDGMGIDYLALYDTEPLCCGLPLWWAGDIDGFARHARRLARTLSSYRLVVCSCPSCAWTLRDLFSQVDCAIPGKVTTEVEILVEKLEGAKKSEEREKPRLAIHHPCVLARHLGAGGVLDRFAELAGCEVVTEAVWSGSDTMCCGGGGLVAEVLPDVASEIARLRLDQLSGGDPGYILTACPGCQHQLGTHSSVPVIGPAELLEITGQCRH